MGRCACGTQMILLDNAGRAGTDRLSYSGTSLPICSGKNGGATRANGPAPRPSTDPDTPGGGYMTTAPAPTTSLNPIMPAASPTAPTGGTSTITTTASTATPTPPTPVTTTATLDPGILVTAILSGTFLAALITAAINLWLVRRRSREEERNRLRNSFAEAFAAYGAYKEFPYAIRRRRADVPAEERIRLSEALREIQASLVYHLAWTMAESETVGQAYTNLVHQVRTTAGAAMHEAWKAPPTDSDNTMNIPPSIIDLSSLAPHEAAYMDAVRAHLTKLAPWWAR